MGAGEALPIATRFATSADHRAVSSACGIFAAARTVVEPEELPALERLLTKTIASKVRSLGWKPLATEPEDIRLLRSILLRAIFLLGDDKELNERARTLALAWLADPKSLHPDITREVVVGSAARADPGFFNALRTAAEKITDASWKSTVLLALGLVRNPELAEQALAWVLSSKRTPDEQMSVLTSLAKPETADVLLRLLQTDYDTIVQRLPQVRSLDRGTSAIQWLSSLCSPEARREVHAFFAERSKSMSGGPRALAQTLEKIDLCVARKAAQQAAATQYLKTVE
jgi:alanyl aminopeptidase